MAKFEVKQDFKDTHTKEIYKTGSEIELTDKRAKEVVANLGNDFLIAVKAEEVKKGDEPLKKKNKK